MIPSCKKIYLCNPAFNIITLLNGLVTSSVSYSIHSKDYQTLSFEVDRFININGKQVESSGYDDLKVFMYVYLEDIGYFQIQQPEITSDGMREYKTITAYSCEKEFEDKDVGIFKVNTGEDGSYERLNEDNIDELGYAKNYVTFYRSNLSGLTDYSLLHLILEYFPNWTVDDDDVDESLWYKKATFDEENINGYALLTSTIAPKFECIITFDIIHRKIGAIAKEHLESSSVQVELPDGTTKTVTYNNDFDTSIFVGFRNLANQISISTDEDSVYTQFTCEGNDDLTFEDVNFGQSTIIDLSYFACEPYMSEETAQKILNWQTWCNENRDTYMSLAKQWADIDDKKTEIEDRVPSDMDYYDQWEEMDSDLLDKNLKYYQTLLQSLQISVDPRPDNEKYTGTGDDKTYNPVKKSDGTTDDDYYMDLLKQQANGYGGYYTYLEIITYVIPNINVAIYNKGKTEANQESYITSYETNWDLYGITELQNKKTTYETVISTLADYKLPYSESGSTTDEDTYNTKYSEYWNAKKHLEELEPYLEALLKEQEELQAQLDEIQNKKLELQHGYQFSYVDDDGNTVYNYDLTEEEVQLINTLIHNTDYTNSNIISTSVDTTVTLIDREKELFDDSVDKLSEVSQPQFNFSVELDNLLRIEEFSGWVEDCSLYRFIRLGFRDNYSIKVRIIGIEYNPCEITPDLTLEFSNMITSRSGRSDLTDILDSENNRGSKNSISLGASTDYDTEFATTLLQTMINTNLFQRSVSNIVGNIEVTGTAVIDEAQIKNLFTEYVEAGEIKVGYISGTQAEFEKFYAQYGLFDSLVAQAIKATEITTDQIRGTNGETFIDLVNSAINVDSIITDVITGKNSDNEYYIDMVTGALNMDKLMSNIITGTDTDSKYYINMLTGALNMDTIVTNLITGQGENSKYYIDMVSGALNLDTVIANLITGTDTDKQYYINMLTGALNMDTIATNLITGKDGNDTYYIDMITGALNMDTISANMAEFGYLTAKSADLAYAKIDFANVADGIIDTALIKDGAIIDAKISSVSANKLTAGTIDASKINVTNLNADNINVGTINGKLIGNASVDLDKLSEEVPTKEYLDSVQNDLQNQIDGAIETFTIDTVPTLTNEPAVNWSDNATKAKHVGDICYVLNENLDENGYCYRFANTGTATSPVYEWVLIKDSDVTKVLQDLVDMQGDISGLKTFETETTKWKSDTDASIESIISNVTKIETNLDTKVDKTTFNEVKQTVDSNSASITTLSNTVDTKIDSLSKTVNEVKQTADTNSSTISSLSKTVETKADGSTVEAIETRTSALEQNLEGFQSTVSNTYVTQTTYNNKVSDLETGISNAQDTATTASKNVSVLQQKADYVLTTVSGSDGTSSFKISSTAMESITDQFIVKSPDGTSTIISGGTLAAYSITADMLNASAIKSQNYVEGTYTGDAGYSMSGTFLDLSNGLVHMPGLYNDISGNTYFRGSITATGGLIGIDSDNSWEIGSVTILERNGTEKEYASLASTGNAIISTGKLQLHDDKLNTFNSGNYLSYDGTFYDYGIQTPELDPNKYDSGNTEKTAGAFLYVRKYTPPSGYTTPPQYDSEWTYLFRVTKDGSIYFGDTLVSGADGAFLSKSGGTITGDLNINGDLTVGGTITGNLNGSITGQAASVAHSISVNGKSFNGSADCNVGTLGVSYGGTGKISWSQYGLLYASTSNVLSQLDVGTSGQILQSNGNATPTWVDQSDLSVSTATKLVTPRTITFLGDTTGELSFDGSEDVSVEMVRRSCYVGQTSYNSSKPYFKFASIETDKASSKYAITFRVAMRSGQVDATAGILTATFDTSSTGTYSSSMFFWEYALRGISTSNFYLAYNSNVSPAVVELWVNCSSFSNNGYYFTVLSETLNGENITNAWTLYNNYGNGESKMTSEYSNETSYMSTSKNSTQGNASSATVLSTARTLTIGSTGKTFNGSSNVSWTLDEIGAASSDHTHAFITDITLNSINKSATDSAHSVTFTRDELLSAVGVGTTSESSPIAAGLITTAERNKLASITVSDIGTVGANSIKGNAPITVSISNGVATISHNTSGITAGTYKSVTVNAYGHITSGTNPTTLLGYGITDALSSATKYAGSSSIGGSATSAVKLETARTISLSGGATGTATSFDGTANIIIPVTELDATLLSGIATIDTTGNASTATLADKAKQDANGNTIDTYYCTLSTEQTLSGKKTFSNVVNISNTTASTSMTSGALTVSGGIGVKGSVSANIVRVNDNVSLEYNNSTESLDFVFA